jgi:hypothetical protein
VNSAACARSMARQMAARAARAAAMAWSTAQRPLSRRELTRRVTQLTGIHGPHRARRALSTAYRAVSSKIDLASPAQVASHLPRFSQKVHFSRSGTVNCQRMSGAALGPPSRNAV